VLLPRLATAAVAIPLLLLLIFRAPPWLFAAVIGLIALGGVAEYIVMAIPGRQRDQWIFISFGAVLAFGACTQQGDLFAAGLAVVLIGGLLWTLFLRPDFEQGLTDLGRAIIGILFTAYLLPHFVWLRAVPDGPDWVVFVVLTAMLGDSAGYFTGRALGRHKLLPRVSPAKTVEGAFGILAGNLLAGVAARLLLLPQLGWVEVLFLAVAQGTLGQFGDFSESIMKRTYGAKDSGWLFPGHGGVLDRIDSLVFPVAGLYYYVIFCR
jgi:phosphatidate cytidylyltransferase